MLRCHEQISEHARVSTDGQTLAAQTEALHACGCARIFAEKISGAYSDRPQLAKAIAALGEGDSSHGHVLVERGQLGLATPVCPRRDRRCVLAASSRLPSGKALRLTQLGPVGLTGTIW